MKNKYSSKDVKVIKKTDETITIFGENIPSVNVVRVEINNVKSNDFRDVVSTYIYYTVEGQGTFVLTEKR